MPAGRNLGWVRIVLALVVLLGVGPGVELAQEKTPQQYAGPAG